MKITLGIDIGGTNTQWGFVNQAGKIVAEGNLSTQKFERAAQLVKELAGEVKKRLIGQNWELIGIGIGAPNGNYFDGTIAFAPNLKWKGIIKLKELFLSYFALPVWVTNDANAAAIGEMQFGAAQGVKDFLIVTLGTGLGSGFVVDGKVVYGHDGFAGELGHTIIEWDGRDCGCGRKGCLETYVSATGIVRTALLLLKKDQSNSLLHSYDNLSAKDIANAATKGDSLALNIFDFTAQKLALALANAVAITSPQLIVLFGGLANAGDLLLLPTQKYLEDYLLHIFKNKISLQISKIPANKAAILGASALAWNNLT